MGVGRQRGHTVGASAARARAAAAQDAESAIPKVSSAREYTHAEETMTLGAEEEAFFYLSNQSSVQQETHASSDHAAY